MHPIDFWVSIGSTYSALTVLRLGSYARARGVTVRWRPFDVRAIMLAQNNIPFRDKPVKAAYMWRDIERRAQRYGLQLRLPAPYPLKELTFANQVAMLGVQQGWVDAYVTESYQLWFTQGLEPGQEPCLQQALERIGLDPAQVVAQADTPGVAQALADQTAEAEGLGIFGAPSFVVGSEVFWGDDRLDDAVDWARAGRLG